MKTQTEIALDLAANAHEGQTRHDGVTPYFSHVLRVAAIVAQRGGGDEEVAAALCHDTLEDTSLSVQDLKDHGLSENVVSAVIDLTHLHDNEKYEYAILRAKANKIARKVKIADNLANLSDSPTDKQILKYAKSLQILMEE